MSLKVAIIPVTALRQNCTLMWCDKTMKGVVIDPGGDVDAINEAINGVGIVVERVLLTHGHFDHVGGAMEMAKRLGVGISGPHKDDAFLSAKAGSVGAQYDIHDGCDVTGNTWLNDGDQIAFGDETLDVIHTPGHTPGHLVFYNATDKVAQVGDVLFKGSVGRTDFAYGDPQTLIVSITTKLWPLGDDVTFIPGHGPTSTFGQERANNPFVGDQALG